MIRTVERVCGMCGIIGILGKGPAVPRLLESLKRLEYRGYDSAGVATLENGAVTRRRAPGKIANLEAVIAASPLSGDAGIGHTRCPPVEKNAHPHIADGVALVHNGIIENFHELRDALAATGAAFESDTDTEVIVQLIAAERAKGFGPRDAVFAALRQLRGAFAIAVLFSGEEDLMIGARRGSPLAATLGEGEAFLGSDGLALEGYAGRITYLEEGDCVVLSRTAMQVYDAQERPVARPVSQLPPVGGGADKGNYRHFMQKEIHEQPDAAQRTIAAYVDPLAEAARLPEGFAVEAGSLTQLSIVACGTAYYAGRVAEYWFEQIAKLPTECDIASEFRYRAPALSSNAAALFVSQSGETADTLAALRLAKEMGLSTLGVVNVPMSAIAREATGVLPTLAGREIGVASTKAFTAQLSALACAAVAFGKARGTIDGAEEKRLITALMGAPRLISEALKAEEAIARIAKTLRTARDVLYVGRGSAYPLALEAALKLKEISYIHAEGYAAGELKHGPIALIDEHTPTIAIAPHDVLFEKTVSNIQEIAARSGPVYLLADAKGIAEATRAVEKAGGTVTGAITAPECDPFVAPLVYATLVHLLAYHVAVQKGTDVDQPRNLAKSVTVE
jgi:glutamine---fructose-6-phosphate transaminase (isomerizing)